jgi:hypothetical protein
MGWFAGLLRGQRLRLAESLLWIQDKPQKADLNPRQRIMGIILSEYFWEYFDQVSGTG